MQNVQAHAAAHDDLPTGLHKAFAIFIRDAKLSVSYEMNFVVQTLSFAVSVVTTWLISSLVAPSAKFGIGGHVASYFQFLIINLAFVTFQGTALQSFARVIREGQMQGTLEVVLTTPTRLSLIVLAGGLWAFVFTFIETVIMFIVAVPFGLDLSHTNVVAACAFLALTVASLSPLGVMSAALTMVLKQTGPFDFVMSSVSYIFGGVFVPLSTLPHVVQVIGWALPITHALNGLRGAVQGANVIQLYPEALWLVAATVILLPLSLFVFDRAVRLAKVDGTLAQY